MSLTLNQSMANSLLLSSLALSLVFILGVYSDDIKHYDGYSVYRLIPTTVNQLKYLHELEENNFEVKIVENLKTSFN